MKKRRILATIAYGHDKLQNKDKTTVSMAWVGGIGDSDSGWNHYSPRTATELTEILTLY